MVAGGGRRPAVAVPTTFAQQSSHRSARPNNVRPGTPRARARERTPHTQTRTGSAAVLVAPHPTPRAPGPITVLRTAEGKSSGRHRPRKRVLADNLTPLMAKSGSAVVANATPATARHQLRALAPPRSERAWHKSARSREPLSYAGVFATLRLASLRSRDHRSC